MAYSPYTSSVVNYVSNHPGCSKMDVDRFVTRNPLRNPNKQYYIVNTAIRNGHIKAEYKRGRYYLTINNIV